jgi:hypothetical protein
VTGARDPGTRQAANCTGKAIAATPSRLASSLADRVTLAVAAKVAAQHVPCQNRITLAAPNVSDRRRSRPWPPRSPSPCPCQRRRCSSPRRRTDRRCRRCRRTRLNWADRRRLTHDDVANSVEVDVDELLGDRCTGGDVLIERDVAPTTKLDRVRCARRGQVDGLRAELHGAERRTRRCLHRAVLALIRWRGLRRSHGRQRARRSGRDRPTADRRQRARAQIGRVIDRVGMRRGRTDRRVAQPSHRAQGRSPGVDPELSVTHGDSFGFATYGSTLVRCALWPFARAPGSLGLDVSSMRRRPDDGLLATSEGCQSSWERAQTLRPLARDESHGARA